ncbi:MAG: PQQ-binding-like beta-propeller repeat protein [Verrucomicrobiales bacterium]|nr:PQQ-binding-like beta-propeller repeat protein [Verrucomicrobiales bacterium]
MNWPTFLALSASLALTANLPADDWPWWRGPDRNGVASPTQDPPLTFGGEENVVWSVEIPGRSHGSAIVVGKKVILAAADEEHDTQSLLCFDRDSGKAIWSSLIHEGGQTQKSNKKASWASSTPASDGEGVFINFVNGDAAWTTAVRLEDGKQLWQKKICDYQIHQGYGSSPAIHEHLVIVSADNKLGGAVVAFERATGKEVWRVARAEMPNYPSPIILKAAGKTQLFLTGTEKVSSFDPLTGQINWEIDGATTECVTSTVTDGKHIYSSGGYPKNHVAAITADGSGKVAWEVNDRAYVPSLLVKGSHLYGTLDSGIGICWDSATGEEKWKGRLGGNFTASPVLVGDRIYAVNESGDCFVFKADPGKFEILAKSKVGDEVMATPTICGGRIYLRVAFHDGEKRSERLICFGK